MGQLSMIGGNTVALDLQLNFLVHGLDALPQERGRSDANKMPTFQHLRHGAWSNGFQGLCIVYIYIYIYIYIGSLFIVHTYYIL